MTDRPNDPWDVLAGTRFALAFIVLAAHLTDRMQIPGGFLHAVADLCAVTATFGFFVISGYSIAHSIARRSQGFYTRRFLRIYPLYVLAVLMSLVADLLYRDITKISYVWHTLVGNLLFLQTFHFPVVNRNPLLWSIAVEAAFYALAPLFMRMKTSVLALLVMLSAISFLVYPWTGLPYFASMYHGLDLLFLGWSWVGGFVYYRVRNYQWAGLLLVAGMVAITSFNSMFTFKWHEVTMAFTMAAVAGGGSVPLWPIVRKIFSFLGDLSYPLYLFQAPVLLISLDILHIHRPWIVVVMCLLFSACMLGLDQLAKKPLARLVERIEKAAASIIRQAKGSQALAAPGLSTQAGSAGVASVE